MSKLHHPFCCYTKIRCAINKIEHVCLCDILGIYDDWRMEIDHEAYKQANNRPLNRRETRAKARRDRGKQ